jgi:hypothetical protein
MKYLIILLFTFSLPLLSNAQDKSTGNKIPMALDSFYLKVEFVDGSKCDYKIFKTTEGWIASDTVLYNMTDFADIQTMLMYIMHVKGTVAKDFLITPLLPRDIYDKLVNRQLYLRDSLQGVH